MSADHNQYSKGAGRVTKNSLLYDKYSSLMVVYHNAVYKYSARPKSRVIVQSQIGQDCLLVTAFKDRF